MRLMLRIVPIITFYIMLVSATSIIRKDTAINNQKNIAVIGNPYHTAKFHKLNFFQRLAFRYLLKKQRLNNGANADKLASTSLLLGIGACAFIVLGLVIPFVILLSIPAGIAAMITGGSAIRNKTTLIGKAKTGKGLGLGALIAFALLLLLIAILIAAIY